MILIFLTTNLVLYHKHKAQRYSKGVITRSTGQWPHWCGSNRGRSVPKLGSGAGLQTLTRAAQSSGSPDKSMVPRQVSGQAGKLRHWVRGRVQSKGMKHQDTCSAAQARTKGEGWGWNAAPEWWGSPVGLLVAIFPLAPSEQPDLATTQQTWLWAWVSRPPEKGTSSLSGCLGPWVKWPHIARQI